MKQLKYGALVLAGLAGCAPKQDGLYTVMVSGKNHTWLEIAPEWHFDGAGQPLPSTYRLYYVREHGWQWWQPTRYDLVGGALADLPMVERLAGDTLAIHLRGYKGLNWQKYTFRGAWPAAQLHK